MKKKTTKSKKEAPAMYFCSFGCREKMEMLPSGSYIARGMLFPEGEMMFHFSDSRDSKASRLGYNGDKRVCAIHRFGLKHDPRASILMNTKKDTYFDVILIKSKPGKFDFQIRFSKENVKSNIPDYRWARTEPVPDEKGF